MLDADSDLDCNPHTMNDENDDDWLQVFINSQPDGGADGKIQYPRVVDQENCNPQVR